MENPLGVSIVKPRLSRDNQPISGSITVTAPTIQEAEIQLRKILKQSNLGVFNDNGVLDTSKPDRGIITTPTASYKGTPFARYTQGTTYIKANIMPDYRQLQRETASLTAEENYASRKQTWNPETQQIVFGPASPKNNYTTYYEEP